MVVQSGWVVTGRPRRGSDMAKGKRCCRTELWISLVVTKRFIWSWEIVGHPRMVFTLTLSLRANEMTHGLPSVQVKGVK